MDKQLEQMRHLADLQRRAPAQARFFGGNYLLGQLGRTRDIPVNTSVVLIDAQLAYPEAPVPLIIRLMSSTETEWANAALRLEWGAGDVHARADLPGVGLYHGLLLPLQSASWVRAVAIASAVAVEGVGASIGFGSAPLPIINAQSVSGLVPGSSIALTLLQNTRRFKVRRLIASIPARISYVRAEVVIAPGEQMDWLERQSDASLAAPVLFNEHPGDEEMSAVLYCELSL